MSTQGLREVAAVLEQVLTDFGRRAADDPRRLRGLLTDTLGVRASDLHDAIEMVVVAAEAGIPQAALGDTDRSLLIDLARTHLPDPEGAADVVDIWAAALRIQDRVPTDGPTVAPPIVAPVEPTLAADDRTGLPVSADDPTRLPGTGDDPTQVVPVVGIPPVETSPGFRERVTAFTSERKAVVFSAAGILVLALGGVGAAAMWSGNGDTATTTTTIEAAETTTSAGETTTTVGSLTAIDHEEQVTSWGATVNRRWEISGDLLVKKVTVESGDEAIEGSVWEVFPETWGFDANTLSFNTSDLMTAVHSNEIAVRLIFDLPPNSSWSSEYSIPLPEGSEDPLFLENLVADWELAMTEFLATPPPSLEITSDRPVGDQKTFRGSTTAGAEVLVNGKNIEVAEDGTFEHTVVLVPGLNVVEVRAVDRVRGQSTTRTFEWPYEAPVTTATTPAGTSPPGTTPPGTTPPGTTPPGTTPPPTEPANQAPVVTCSTSQYGVLEGIDTIYTVHINKANCFSDPDGDSFTLKASQTDWGSIATANVSSCPGGAGACWWYYPYSGWNGTPYEAHHQIWAVDEHGAESTRINVTWCVNC